MLEIFKPKFLSDVMAFVKDNKDIDFYFTQNNSRVYIENKYQLKQFIKESSFPFVLYDKGSIIGIILLWKSLGNGLLRHYVKINAINSKIAEDLITILLWHVDKDLFVKINKNSIFFKSFQKKGFKFIGDRGKESLLLFPKEKSRKIVYGNHFKSDT